MHMWVLSNTHNNSNRFQAARRPKDADVTVAWQEKNCTVNYTVNNLKKLFFYIYVPQNMYTQ
jgi:hypothetical protein